MGVTASYIASGIRQSKSKKSKIEYGYFVLSDYIITYGGAAIHRFTISPFDLYHLI